MQPFWTDTGAPANVDAALMDSWQWLKLLQVIIEKNPTVLLMKPEENAARLAQCIACVEKLLDEDNHER